VAGAFIGLCRQLEALASTCDAAGAGKLLSEIEAEYIQNCLLIRIRCLVGWNENTGNLAMMCF